MLLATSLIGLLLAGAGLTLMFNEVYIPAPISPLVAIGIMTSLFYVIKFKKNVDAVGFKQALSMLVMLKKSKHETNKGPGRILIVANTLFIVMTLSALAHDHWKWETMVTNVAMMKIVLILLGFLGVYLNIMYFRAESSYKEKRQNQRIKDEPDESLDEVKKVAKIAKSGKGEVAAVLGESREHSGYPIVLKGDDFYVHSIFVGSTGSGKTASILEPLAYQLLVQKKKGKKLGLTVVEPKRDYALQVKEYCDEMDIPCVFIDPLSDETGRFNPMEGEINQVAEATVVVLQGLFGKQDPFFASVQELSARNVTKLLKELYEDDLDIIDVMNTLRDPDELKRKVQELKARDGMTDLVHFFEAELLGQHAEKYRQFVIGLRSQLENITSNDLLRRIMTGKSDLNINKHFEEGGVLIVNTELGRLGKSGNIFGQFLIMHLQNGTFNRPGPKQDRIPHYMIIDEYSLYINPEIERFLSVARSYKVAGIFATQSLGQLEVESGKLSGKAIRQTIMTNCRNQLVFGGVSSDDAKQFAEEFGTEKIIMRQPTYKHKVFMPVLFPESYRDTETEEYRFDPTDIMTQLKKYTFIHKIMYDNQVQQPEVGKGILVPKNWKKLKEWENKNVFSKSKRLYKKSVETGKKVYEKKKLRDEQRMEKSKEQTTGLDKQGGPDSSKDKTKRVSFEEPTEPVEIEKMQETQEVPEQPPISNGNVVAEEDIETDENKTSFKQEESIPVVDDSSVSAAKKDKKQREAKKEFIPPASGDDGFWD